MEGENDEQSSTDQASAVKTKTVFIAQNVASLQELGKALHCCQKAGSSASFSAFKKSLRNQTADKPVGKVKPFH